MKIPGLIKSFPILSSLLISAVAFGLYHSYTTTSETPDIYANRAFAPADTLVPRSKKAQDSLFIVLQNSADRWFNAKDYEKSQADLEKAQLIRPADQAVKAKLIKVRGLVVEQKQQREASQKALSSGDAYFKAKDYLNAKASYQLAVGLNAGDQVAKEKLQKTLDLLRSQKAQNILFDVAIASADKLFQAGDYTRAQQEYENAIRMLPGDPYPRNKINEIIKILVDKQVKDEEYSKAIASADKLYLLKNFQSALIDYKKANVIKPGEKYPEDRIKEITSILAALKAKDDAYLKAIAMADQFFKDTRYTEAINSYKDALTIKPEESYPKDKIREIEGLIARNRNAQADYDRYITIGDSLYIDKQYMKARENYLMATSVKPAESYPKEMVSKADRMLTGQEASMAKALDEQYAKTIADAEKLLTEKSYEPSRAAYLKASNLKPAEKYPKDKIREIDNILANALKDKEEQYKLIIASADKALADKSYETARTDYQNALTVKPNESYPKLKIAEIEKLIAAETERQKTLENQYTVLIAKADKLLAGKSYAPARTEYAHAGELKPLETYPREKIAEIDKVLSDLAAAKAFDDHYIRMLDEADKLLTAKEYDQARLAYQNASSLKPSEQYPKDKVVEIDKALADMAARISLEENYKATIARADVYFAAKTYETAKAEYSKASDLMPLEQYPKSKISEIESILAAAARQKAMEDEYASAISRADKLLTDKSYEPALTEYQAALKIKPAEQYPQGKVGEITQILAGLEKQKSIEAQYSAAISKADKLLAEKSYPGARTEYVNASAIKPLETYPQEKIAAIDKILTDLAAAKALDDRYAGIIAGADKLLAAKTYDQARNEYENAGKVKPAEAYPKEKIAEIDKILADIAAAKSLDENYQTTIANADKRFAEKNYEVAKNEYSKASALKPAETYPTGKITEIESILAAIARQKALDDEYAASIAKADKLLSDKSYDLSKVQYQAALGIRPAEQYPKDKISEIDRALADLAAVRDRDEKYNAAVAGADKLMLEKSYAPARIEYVNASSIKPQESYPKDKIAEIDGLLAAIAAAKALNDKYAGIIATADKLLADKTYDQARVEYLNAGKLKPSEIYPNEKIAVIDKILADIAAQKTLDENYRASIAKADQLLTAKSYEPAKTEYARASSLKPAETYPGSKIAEIDAILSGIARQKALDDEYSATIAGADKLLAEKSYEMAKAEYQKATVLKTAEQYPKTRLVEIEKALAEIARIKAIDDQYADAIAGADKLLQDKSYDEAKTAYIEAGKIKPAEQYPKDKISEINGIVSAIAKQKTLDDQYRSALAKADQLFTAKTYDQAKIEYLNAGNLKPDEQYPKDKITEIDGILAEMKAKEDAYKATVAGADQMMVQKKYEDARVEYRKALEIKPQATYPNEKIAEINKALEDLLGKQKFYENLIVSGDNSYNEKDYAKARETYQQALGLFPSQTYPKDRITLITTRIDSLYRANKSLYDKAVADGDKFFNTFEFDKAIDAYTDAANFLPMETYPREMIAKIRRTIAENAIADVLKSSVTITAETEKQFPFQPVNIASRKNNFIYIKIRNLSGKPFNVLMRYGKDKQANGGVVMKNLSLDGKVNERLVSVRDQDLWSREDNNWISLYPQGGDVEVSFIQVSRAK
jgi:tetratricopeptide (TPR) repeat protein